MSDNYKNILNDLLAGYDFVERDRFSEDDFVTIICPEHGIYYKTVKDILREEPSCPKCSFLKEDRMQNILSQARSNFKEGDNSEINALYYRLHIVHKKTGLVFQKIGITENDESFVEFWNPWKWGDFEIEPIDKIKCNINEAKEIEKIFQEEHQDLKMTVPNQLKFNLNKTYHFNEVWQAKSKTIPILRDIMLQKQKGKCTICNKPVKAPTLDHMHIKKIKGTGYIRAVCCSQCNTFIARSENNAMRHGISNKELPEVLRNMALHLETQTKVIHPTEVPKRKKVGVREWNRVRKYYFKVYPNRKTLPKRPTYVTESWLRLKNTVNDYIEEIEYQKMLKKKLNKEK